MPARGCVAQVQRLGPAPAGAATGAAASSRGAVVREPAMWRVARWRSTASSILRTRDISSSVDRLRVEDDEVVDALLLVQDRIREAPTPQASWLCHEPPLFSTRSRARATMSSCAPRPARGPAAAESRTSSKSRCPSFPWSRCRPRLPAPLGTERHDDGAGSAATVASVAMRRLTAWIAGVAGGVVAYRFWRRRPEAAAGPSAEPVAEDAGRAGRGAAGEARREPRVR